MLGELAPTRGEVEIGARTEINYVDQNRLLLDDAKTVWEEVGEGSEFVRLGEENITLRGYLRRFLFTEERINTKIDQLSGGERSRVLLAKILKRGGNVLILDEPTNDLDLGTLRLLEEALVAFRRKRDRRQPRPLFSEPRLHSDPGLRRRRLPSITPSAITIITSKNEDALLKRRRRPWPRRTLSEAAVSAPSYDTPANEAAQTEMERGTRAGRNGGGDSRGGRRSRRIEAIFADPDFYATHAADWQKLEAELRVARDQVAQLYARWAGARARIARR